MQSPRSAFVAVALSAVCFSMLAPGSLTLGLWLDQGSRCGTGIAFAAGNKGSAPVSQLAPCVLTITCPSNKTVECDQPTDPWFTGTATYSASADCGNITLTYSDAVTPGACPRTKTIARTWTATAGSGDVATCVQSIIVEDTLAPAFQCLSNLSVKCMAEVPGCSFGGLGAYDNCGLFYPVLCTRTDNGGRGCPGDPLIITDTFFSTDSCGNRSECHRTITVVDDVPPVLTGCPPNQTIACVGDLPPCDPQVKAVDNCDGTLSVMCTDGPLTGDPCSGTIDRTYRATDRCGNTTSCTQVFTIRDNVAPVISCPANRQLQCGESTDPANTGVATAVDNCGGAVTISYTDATIPGGCSGNANIDRTWRTADGCGNTSFCVQHITFVDNTQPVITTSPDTVVHSDSGVCGAVVTFLASAVDNCDGPIPISCDRVSGSFFPTGTTVVHCKATDACGNITTHSFHITVVSCPCHHDPVCDSVSNILDIVAVIEVAFRGGDAHMDRCPVPREDVDCNGIVDIRDVVKMVNVAFRGAYAGTEFCKPCG